MSQLRLGSCIEPQSALQEKHSAFEKQALLHSTVFPIGPVQWASSEQENCASYTNGAYLVQLSIGNWVKQELLFSPIHCTGWEQTRMLFALYMPGKHKCAVLSLNEHLLLELESQRDSTPFRKFNWTLVCHARKTLCFRENSIFALYCVSYRARTVS